MSQEVWIARLLDAITSHRAGRLDSASAVLGAKKVGLATEKEPLRKYQNICNKGYYKIENHSYCIKSICKGMDLEN